MTCKRFGNATICIADVYEFNGLLFELHPWCGVVPLNRCTGEPRKTMPPKLDAIAKRFTRLTRKQREQYRVEVRR